MKLKLFCSALILFLGIFSYYTIGINNTSGTVSRENVSDILKRYESFLNETDEFVIALARNPEAARALSENNIDYIPPNTFGATYSLYTIQGYALDDETKSIRDNSAFSRLMGHMDFQTVIENDNIAIYSKVYDKAYVDSGHINFLGIIKSEIPFSKLKEKLDDLSGSYFLLDTSKNFLILPEMKTVSVEGDEELNELVKELMLMQQKEGTVKVQTAEIKGEYYYKIGNRAIAGYKIR